MAALADRFILDEAAFRNSLAFPLEPTNLKGVFHAPAPSETFHPDTASAAELVTNGILIRRPSDTDPQALQDAWRRVFSRKWAAKDRIVPVSVPQPGKVHIMRRAARKATETSYVGFQWAGGVVDTGVWTGAIGFWNIPTVSKPSELQAGIQQCVDANGQASYVAWYEWYAPPQPHSPGYIFQTNIPNFAVAAGDQVYCSAQYINNRTAGRSSSRTRRRDSIFQLRCASAGRDFPGEHDRVDHGGAGRRRTAFGASPVHAREIHILHRLRAEQRDRKPAERRSGKRGDDHEQDPYGDYAWQQRSHRNIRRVKGRLSAILIA
jgi:hypothetical protein